MSCFIFMAWWGDRVPVAIGVGDFAYFLLITVHRGMPCDAQIVEKSLTGMAETGLFVWVVVHQLCLYLLANFFLGAVYLYDAVFELPGAPAVATVDAFDTAGCEGCAHQATGGEIDS
jgi:hypothetical protein